MVILCEKEYSVIVTLSKKNKTFMSDEMTFVTSTVGYCKAKGLNDIASHDGRLTVLYDFLR